MDIVPFTTAAGNNGDGGVGGRQEQEANQYFLHLLQENTQVNLFVNDPRIQSALELRAEQRHRFVLDNVYAEANAYIAHLEATADANHRQQLAFVSQSTHLLVGQLHNEVRVLETIARAERQSANELQAQLARAQRESHDERSMAMQFDAHRSELKAAARTLTAENRQHERRFAELRSSIEENHSEMIAFLGSEFEEKLQWEENEYYHRLTSEAQQYDSLVDDLQDRNAELIAEVDSLRTVLSTAESSPPQGGAVPVKVDPSESSKLQPSPPQGGAAATSPATLSSVGSAHEVISGGKGGKGGEKKDTSKIPCIFFPKGTCKNGKNCPFMHKDAAPSVPAKGDKAGKDGKRSPSGKRRRPSKKRPKSEDKPAACCLSLTATLTGESLADAVKAYAVAARKGPAGKPRSRKVQFLRPEIIDIPPEGEGWSFVPDKHKFEFRYKSAELCPPSIPEDTEEALQNARVGVEKDSAFTAKKQFPCPNLLQRTIDGMLSGKVLSPAGAAEDPIEKMANCIPPIPGVETRQLLKAGWTVINGSPDDVWSLLEDSVNIDELDGIYGEAQADSDVEPYTMPKSKKDEQLSEDLDEMFPELFGPDRDKDPPPKDAKEATRKGESKSDSRAALLDDVPFSVKQKLKSSAAVAAQEPPYGYTWSGECLVKKNNKNRPNAIDHTAWKAMSKRQRATAIAEHEKKLHEENEALYREAVKVDWWDGETYFDLAGREQSDFELAVAAARKGKPVGHFKLLNVGTAEQVADVFTKPFTEKNKWTHALKLIGHTTSANVAGCKPESKVEVDNKVSVAAAPDASKVVEDFAKQSFEANDYSFKTFEKLMAAIVVSDEFCRVNTSEADRAGVTKAMKTILQSAALNNDIISLGADHESQLLESAYSCVSTQCAAGVSLTHADATCVALRQMADLSDEGLAKLKPTARLSPKAKRAIIVVSDSSTALCKKNRRGVFVKADLDAEVNIASWTLGWAQTRYTMCWGKTLAWIVWQVEEHVKELRSNYPDHTIDVICWWCGNEISGQWGCIPTRLGPGLAYRDPNVTTETVARKVRRAADVLAALAGEPDIGFVKVTGQVEADLFQLHSAYNDFNAAMFEEFRQRGLQVQTASSLVEKLEMYDSFHASEDPRNRELFQTYLHATFNASRSEWLAQKMTPCVRALLVRYEHFETGSGANNPVLEDVLKQWRAEKDQLMNPKQAKPMPVTQEDKMWEAPDAADATDVTKISEGPPMDKAIRKDVPRIGATTDVSAVAECVNDIVTQDADGKVSYNTPGTVELVDEGDQVDPIPSSVGRVVEPAPPKKTKKSDRDEDAMRRLMFIDESAPQGAATVPELPNEYFYNGKKHLMKPFNPEDIVGDRHVTFKHGDLKFLTKLLRGHEMDDFPALIFDRGCWADVDTLLQVFNTARNARWGVRQLLRAAKADNKGRIRLLGIDVPMKDTLGQPLFPVLVRMAQGHNSKLIGNNPDADFFLATRFYSGLSEYEADLQSSVRGVTVLSREDTPPKLFHRTNEKGMKGILRDGMIAGSARSDRSHNYLSPYKLDDTHYKSGMRSNQPIELTIDTQRAIAAGCVFFVTETDGVLTRDNVPPDCVLSAIDTSNKNLPLYVAEHKEAAREGEPERIFRAKRDYEEAAAASSSSAPPPKQAAIAPKAIASKKMPKVVPKPAAIAEKDESMDLDEATREGEPADAAGAFDLDETKVEVEVEVDEGDTTDAGEDEPYPLGSHPCRECAAVVANGMLFCLRCKAPQTDDSKKITKRVFENSRLRQRLLATAATGAQKPIDDLLASDLRGLGEGPKKRGQMSAEAAAIRDAKDRKIRAAKLNFDTVSDRFEKDAQFNVRMMQEGRNFEDMQKFDHLSNAVLPDPGRSEEQRYLRAGSHYGGGNVPPAKLVYYAHCEVEPLRNLRFIDDTADVPIGLTYLGAFLPPRLYAEVAAVNDAAKRILTFDGEVYVSATTTEGITTEIGQILTDSLRSAQNQTDQTERLAERNRQAAVQNRPSQKGRGRTTAPEPMYRGYTQAQWDEYYRQRRGGYTQAEWDAWNRTHRR
ncbi:unnamed protein product [Symbiodinium sp. CCMP2592]|nr:unnamed protein product [Symbiodinium sp. CCMP2592]